MKTKILTLFLLASFSTTSLLSGDIERKGTTGSAAEGGSYAATSMSMLAWGAGLAVVIGGAAALFSKSSGSGSSGH